MDHVTSLADASVMQGMLEASATAAQAVTMDFHTASVSHSTLLKSPLVIVVLLTELKGTLATVKRSKADFWSARSSPERIKELWAVNGTYIDWWSYAIGMNMVT